MQNNTHQESNFGLFSQNYLSDAQFTQALQKWIFEPKKSRKQAKWNQFLFTFIKILIPDIQIDQLLISIDFLVEKTHHFANLCKFKSQTLFNGIQIRLNEGFIQYDCSQKLQRVIMEGKQIKQVSPLNHFQVVKRGDMTTLDRKQKMFIYSRQKNKKTIFLTVELKLIQRFRNELFKEDRSNKLNFVSSFLFGDSCSSFGVSGIKILGIKQKQIVKNKINLKSDNIYVIYQGTFVCFVQPINEAPQINCSATSNSVEVISQMAQSITQVKRQQECSQKSNLNKMIINQNHQHKSFKLELNAGSIIQSAGFVQVIGRLNSINSYKFLNCKAIVDSIVLQIKATQFFRDISLNEISKKYFLGRYDQILSTRNNIFQQSRHVLNNMLQKQSPTNINQMEFAIFKRKTNRSFVCRTSRNSLQGIQNLATIDIYETMIKNKEKVISLQKEYLDRSQRKGSQSNTKMYQNSKKIKQNYNRLKTKDFQIQKLALNNSVSQPKGSAGFSDIKSRLNEVKGIFQDQVEQVQRLFNEQRKMQVQVKAQGQNQKHQDKKHQQKRNRLRSYSPGGFQSCQIRQKLNSTCFNSRRRISMTQSIEKSCHGENQSPVLSKTDVFFKSERILRNPKESKKQIYKQNPSQDSRIKVLINGFKSSSKQIFYDPLKCSTNLPNQQEKRINRKTKTCLRVGRKSEMDEANSKKCLFSQFDQIFAV